MNPTEKAISKKLLSRVSKDVEAGNDPEFSIERYDAFLKCVERRIAIDITARFPLGMTASAVTESLAKEAPPTGHAAIDQSE